MTIKNKSVCHKTLTTQNNVLFLIPIILSFVCATGCKSKTTPIETPASQPQDAIETPVPQADTNKAGEEKINAVEQKKQADENQPSGLANANNDDGPKPSTVPLDIPWKCAAEHCRLSIDNPDILIPKNAIADGNTVRCGKSELDYSPVLETVADQLEDEKHVIDLYDIIQVIPGGEMINFACEDEHFVCQKDNCETSVRADESYITNFSIDHENSEYIIGHEPFDISFDHVDFANSDSNFCEKGSCPCGEHICSIGQKCIQGDCWFNGLIANGSGEFVYHNIDVYNSVWEDDECDDDAKDCGYFFHNDWDTSDPVELICCQRKEGCWTLAGTHYPFETCVGLSDDLAHDDSAIEKSNIYSDNAEFCKTKTCACGEKTCQRGQVCVAGNCEHIRCLKGLTTFESGRDSDFVDATIHYYGSPEQLKIAGFRDLLGILGENMNNKHTEPYTEVADKQENNEVAEAKDSKSAQNLELPPISLPEGSKLLSESQLNSLVIKCQDKNGCACGNSKCSNGEECFNGICLSNSHIKNAAGINYISESEECAPSDLIKLDLTQYACLEAEFLVMYREYIDGYDCQEYSKTYTYGIPRCTKAEGCTCDDKQCPFYTLCLAGECVYDKQYETDMCDISLKQQNDADRREWDNFSPAKHIDKTGQCICSGEVRPAEFRRNSEHSYKCHNGWKQVTDEDKEEIEYLPGCGV